MAAFPLPPVPNFRVTTGMPGFVRLNWADYPISVKEGHRIKGFRVYRSALKDELGELIADEADLGSNAFQFDDMDSQAGPDRYYVCVAAEEAGDGATPFGQGPYGDPDLNGIGYLPYSQRPFGSPLRGWGLSPFGAEGYGF